MCQVGFCSLLFSCYLSLPAPLSVSELVTLRARRGSMLNFDKRGFEFSSKLLGASLQCA